MLINLRNYKSTGRCIDINDKYTHIHTHIYISYTYMCMYFSLVPVPLEGVPNCEEGNTSCLAQLMTALA